MVRILTTPVLVTVNVTYYRPDYRSILNEFLCQFDDIPPELKRVHKFLNFWKENIDAVIHKIEIAIPSHGSSWRAVDWYHKAGEA